MGFTYFQFLGLVIFKSSFFTKHQETNKSLYVKLREENKELKDLLLAKALPITEVKLLNRIKALQDIIVDDRLLRKEDVLTLNNKTSLIKSLSSTNVSNTFLIRDLWNLIKDIDISKHRLGLTICKEKLDKCEEKTKNALILIEDIKVKLVTDEMTIVKDEVVLRDKMSIYA